MLPCFSTLFTKRGNFCNFLFAFLDLTTLQNWDNCTSKEFSLIGENSFLYELILPEKLWQSESCSAVFLNVDPLTLL